MIVPMNKVYLILLDAYREESLKVLKELGVVHLEDCSGSSDALDSLKERRDRVQQALIGLADANGGAPKEGIDPEAKAKEILDLLAEKKETHERINRLIKEEEALKGWGDFEPGDIRFLHDEGIGVLLLQIPKKGASVLKERVNAYCVDDSGPMHRYALIEDTDDLPPEAHPFPLPQQSLSGLRESLRKSEERLAQIDTALADETASRTSLEAFRRELEEEIRFEEVRAGVGTDQELVHLHGFVPQNRTDKLKAAAAAHGWGLMLREPEAHEYVPTLVERRGPVKLAKPIFDLMGTLPGYREFDISLIFLSAFTIFVAMIVGDAGYGMIFLALAFWGLAKAPESAKLPLKLTVMLSSAIVIWGTITGTWFGSETIASWGPLNKLVIPQIASFPEEGINSVKAVQLLCFIIGIVQLSLARIEMFVRTLPRLKAFEHLGWLALLWGLFFLALNIVLGITSWLNVEFTPLIVPLAVAGFALIVLFSNQQGRFFRDMLAGLNPINLLLNFLDGVSSFSNIISYIRLFAVGLSSVAVAASFNAMALSIGFDGPQAVGAVLMLIIGHALNIILALMSIIVHGIRLNMLEYSGQLGLEWSGYAYEPFAKRAA
jgi:V/A-type H+/Na+-transporting ATPase subunit I